MLRSFVLLSILLFPIFSVAKNVTPINSSNWIYHPSIKEIRSIYNDIQKKKSNYKFSVLEKKFDYCKPYEDTERKLFLDRFHIPRYYSYSGGSDDSAITWQFYYDSSGKLRFAFITAAAVNSTEIQHRIYFNKNGHRIWEMQKLKGPGYTFPTGYWPDSDLVHFPKQQFYSKNPCPEIKK